jgi:hypothetical protein
MSEDGDFTPGVWAGYDFSSARKSYDVHVGRSYGDAVASGKNLKDLIPAHVSTKSESPLVIACDVTGSMGEWPAVIFSKLPYLELEGKEYLGPSMEISFAAVGDAYCDNYPLQVRPFASGKDLEKRLKELIIEGGGGGQVMESYDLAGLYYARNAGMPNAIKPIFIYIGDEMLYDNVAEDQAKDVARTITNGRMTSRQVIEELKNKFSVYLIRKNYDTSSNNSISSTDRRIQEQWESYLGADHVAMLPEAQRVVDVIFGILAKETGKLDYFKKEITERQKPEQVKTVMKSLYTIHRDIKPVKSRLKLPKGRSVTWHDDDDDGAPAKSLV